MRKRKHQIKKDFGSKEAFKNSKAEFLARRKIAERPISVSFRYC